MAKKTKQKTASSATALAAYTMYAPEGLKPHIRTFWAGMAARLKDAGQGGVPARLTWNQSEEDLWRAPNLLLTQTCGYPMMKGITGAVRLVATPSYAAPYVEGAEYRSLVVVPKTSDVTNIEGLRGRIAAINKPHSQSGYNALRRLIADYVHMRVADDGDIPDLCGGHAYFAKVITTGSHQSSLEALAKSKADVAAIDAVSFHLIGQENPALTDAVRLLTLTLPAPGLPLITAHWRPDDELQTLREALVDCLGDPKLRPALDAMCITGFHFLDREAYAPVLEMERRAEDMGYPVLR